MDLNICAGTAVSFIRRSTIDNHQVYHRTLSIWQRRSLSPEGPNCQTCQTEATRQLSQLRLALVRLQLLVNLMTKAPLYSLPAGLGMIGADGMSGTPSKHVAPSYLSLVFFLLVGRYGCASTFRARRH
ncbi:hypothetical protein BC835DRAFT_56563 [Cytidiella melzeri]|nr:hypothetical protein BC835DRAFT_56563 [Cytidiella melzeri]